MDEYDRYFYDLNGYIVVERALSPEQVEALNEAIDHNRDRIGEVSPENSLDGRSPEHGGRSAEGLKGTHGRGNIGGYLFWERPWCEPFREIIAPPRIMRMMLTIIGPRFRFEGTGGICMTKGAEGFMLHGGGTPELEIMREQFFHRFQFGRMSSGLISVSYALTDEGEEDGGFVCIPGSHKANFLCPQDVRRLERDLGIVNKIPLKAGDAVIFTEALTHGTVPWKADYERRLLRYLYAPALHVRPKPQFADIAGELDELQKLMVLEHDWREDVEATIAAAEKGAT